MDELLSSLDSVGVRTMWANEAVDFTPWLANNLGMLASAIGLELELESTEVSVGPYWADILAKDIGSGKHVVIENQLERTNHDHLGKALTYAAVIDASAVIWVAPQFTPEHKKALDWLNDHTSSEIAVYGVTVELWKIDDSRPAVRFDVISQPTEIVRQAAISIQTKELSEARKLQLNFWREFREMLIETGKIPSVQSARPQYWYDVSLGRTGVVLSNTVNTFENKIGVRVYISNKVSVALPKLMSMRSEIEEELGEKLDWDPNPNNKDKVIGIYRDADLVDDQSRRCAIEWMKDMTVRFREVFSPRIMDMDFAAEVESPRNE